MKKSANMTDFPCFGVCKLYERWLIFWIRAVLVVTTVAFFGHQDNQPNRANKWNQHDKIIPAAFAHIMQPSDRNGNTWQQRQQRKRRINIPVRQWCKVGAHAAVNHHTHNGENDLEQDEHPIFLSSGATVEVSVLFQCF